MRIQSARSIARLLLALPLALVPALRAGADPVPEPKREVNGVRLVRAYPDRVEPGQRILVSFPKAMVAAEAIKGPAAVAPLVFSPGLPGSFEWRSPTEGWYKVAGHPAPGARYVLGLAPGLKDADGLPVSAPGWGAAFVSPPFRVSRGGNTPSGVIGRKPRVTVKFTHEVRFMDAMRGIHFQDRDSRESFPAAGILHTSASSEREDDPLGKTLQVEPAADLPLMRTVDLVIDEVRDAHTGTPLPYPGVIRLGRTEPLALVEVDAQTPVTGKPQLLLEFNTAVDAGSITGEAIQVDPRPEDFKINAASSKYIYAQGAFRPGVRYTVTVTPELKSAGGYAMRKTHSLDATFGALHPAFLFPWGNAVLRASKGLDFSFLQVNTGEATWKLARVPVEKLPACDNRIHEFSGTLQDPVTGYSMRDPQTGYARNRPTELLVDALGLETVATGAFPASGPEGRDRRRIQWKSEAGKVPAGAYLLEVSAKTPRGKTVGNRALVYFSSLIAAKKADRAHETFKLMRMDDLAPVKDARVTAVNRLNHMLACGRSGADGIVKLDRAALRGNSNRSARRFIIEQGDDTEVLPAGHARFWDSGYPWGGDDKGVRNLLVTDRDLYRPGERLKLKGYFRRYAGAESALSIPAGESVTWTVHRNGNREPVATGKTTIDPYGGMEAEWAVPGDAPLGRYTLKTSLGGYKSVKVEEYRTPLFTVKPEPGSPEGESFRMRVRSTYFHGGANAGARAVLTTSWRPESWFGGYARADEHSPGRPALPAGMQSGMEIKLDDRGEGEFTMTIPFPDTSAVARSHVGWKVAVTSAEGQTMEAGGYSKVQPREAAIGVSVSEPARKDSQAGPQLAVSLNATSPKDEAVDGLPARVEVYLVQANTVKERLAANLFRYVNSEEFVKVAERSGKTGAMLEIDVEKPGRYIVVARLADAPGAPAASDSVTVSGTGSARFAQSNDAQLTLRPADPKKESHRPGETAAFVVESPFTGRAWVSIENEKLREQFEIELTGNATRIEIPVKKEYHPNCFLSVYAVKPGEAESLPAERYGGVEIRVERPELQLEVTPAILTANVEPGMQVRGSVEVVCEGRPLPNADLTVFAVDDAVWRLGMSSIPDFKNTFHPRRGHQVATYRVLGSLMDRAGDGELYEKGFIIGGGGDDEFGMGAPPVPPRRNFTPLACWKTGLRTDKDGRAAYSFTVPDSLTAYRVVALVQTKRHQFGAGDTTFSVSKRLMAQPALPRFVRHSDEIELRFVVRQSFGDNEAVKVACLTDENLSLTERNTAERPARRDRPEVFTFRGTVTGWGRTTVKFRAQSSGNAEIADVVEVTIPIHMPGIVRHTAVFGGLQPDGNAWNLRGRLPKKWAGVEEADYKVTVSGTPWLPKLTGLPAILEYPHGCFEQITDRYIAYSMLGELLAFLPDLEGRDEEYRRHVEDGLKKYRDAQLGNGMIPYWPGGGTGNPFVTAMAGWVTQNAKAAGYTIPAGLEPGLAKAMMAIVDRKSGFRANDFTRCLALYIAGAGGQAPKPYAHLLDDLYLNRQKLSEEARALLALALHEFGIMEKEKRQLVREIDGPIPDRAFDPETFGSSTRAEAVRMLARARIGGPEWEKSGRKEARDKLMVLLDSSVALSTQENIWLLLAFKAMHANETFPVLETDGLDPAPALVSANGVSVCWKNLTTADVNGFRPALAGGDPLHYLVSAKLLYLPGQMEREDGGIRIERVVRNLTDAARNGKQDSPFHLGDQLALTYRIVTARRHYYTALVDELPAGIETVNFNLPQISAFYELPAELGEGAMGLDHSELRDQRANLYFDRLPSGASHYTILARVTSAGRFTWPSAEISPMYESRFSGLSAPSPCHAVAK